MQVSAVSCGAADKRKRRGIIETLSRHLPGGTEESHEKSVRLERVPAEIRNERLPKASQGCPARLPWSEDGRQLFRLPPAQSSRVAHLYRCKSGNIKGRKRKTIPVTGREGREGGFQYFLDNRLTDGGEVISLMRRPPFTPRKIPGTHFR
jgi:hypothetical protein